MLAAGPSALDDDHTYVIVGRNEGARATDGPTDLNGSLTLLKIRLSDADVVSSAQLSTGFPIYFVGVTGTNGKTTTTTLLGEFFKKYGLLFPA